MTTNLMRLKLDMSAVADMMLDTLPSEVWDNPSATFFDPSMSAGQLLAEVVSRLRARGFSDENIAGRVFGFGDSKAALLYGVNNYKLLGQFEVANFLEVKMSKKFDVIISNPPYGSGDGLHQQFFNAATDQLVDGGSLVFIQPATAYHNKKARRKAHDEKMIANIKENTVSVIFLGYDVFENIAGGATQLAMTTLTKVSGNGNIVKCVYRSGKVVENINIEDVHITELDPDILRSIRLKYSTYIEKNGSLSDISGKFAVSDTTVRLPRFTGGFGEARYYSIVTNDMKTTADAVSHHDKYWSVEVANRDFFIDYAKTYVARFGLVFLKFYQNNDRGEFDMVPLVPFDRHWTDETLAELIGLTAAELNIIRSVLPDYHNLLGADLEEFTE